jgi:NAD(P)-dependent dehydrogenase (short-subunit alcohol dehydrogenase family)
MRAAMKMFGSANEVVGAAIVLASDAANLMTGPVVIVDGGFLASRANLRRTFSQGARALTGALENVNRSSPAR